MFNPFTLISHVLFIPVLIFAVIMKGLALWHAAKKDQLGWFVALLIFQTLGILEIIYLIAFRSDADPQYKNWFKSTFGKSNKNHIHDINPHQK